MTSSAKDDADRRCLAARFVDGPELSAAAEAEQRLAAWLGDVGPTSDGGGWLWRRSDGASFGMRTSSDEM